MNEEEMKEIIIEEGTKREIWYKGFNLLILRMPTMFHLAGYIQINDRNVDINNLNYMPHGGITYEGPNPLTRDESEHWIGIDMAHANDLVPFFVFKTLHNKPVPYDRGIYRNMDYVINELKKTVDSIIEQKGRLKNERIT